MSRSALYVAMEYRAAEVRKKGHEHNFEARHASGYFKRVWSVHPLADLVGAPKHGIETIEFTPRHTVIEGVTELYRLPRFLFPLNLLLSQAVLLRRLAKLVRAEKISVIVTTDPFYSGLFGLVLKWLTGRPLAVRIGGNYDELHRESGALAMPRLLPSFRLQNAVAEFVLSRADLVAGNNRNNLDWGIAHGASGQTAILPISGNIQRIHLVPPEQRAPRAEVLRRLELPEGGPLLLYLGRLIALKHPDDALRAMAAIIEREPKASGILAGAGPMRDELERLAEELGVAERIHLLGETNQQDLSDLVPHCITLSPVTGLALIECALGGSPVVAYDRDWQAEFVTDGEDGFVVPSRDWEAMAERVLEIIERPALAARFSAAIRKRALEWVDPERLRATEQAVFDRLLSG